MNQRLRENFRDRPQLEREVLDALVADGLIARAALFDIFVDKGRSPAEIHQAVTNLLDDRLVTHWGADYSRLPEQLKQRMKERPLRQPNWERLHAGVYDGTFGYRTADLVFAPGRALRNAILENPTWVDRNEDIIPEIDELNRRW